jgi:hypothetical protein
VVFITTVALETFEAFEPSEEFGTMLGVVVSLDVDEFVVILGEVGVAGMVVLSVWLESGMIGS